MNFSTPDASMYRLSECGRYLIRKDVINGEAWYQVWEYQHTSPDVRTIDAAKDWIQTRETARCRPELAQQVNAELSTGRHD